MADFIELTLHMLTGNADTFMLSQYADEAVAAVGVANQLLFMVVVMFGFIATGTSILIAQYAGANDEKQLPTSELFPFGQICYLASY